MGALRRRDAGAEFDIGAGIDYFEIKNSRNGSGRHRP